MRLSIDWLRDHVDLGGKSPAEVAELYTLHVAEVNEVVEPGGGWPGIVVGEVTRVKPHPNADKLRLVEVDAGDATRPEVVCGAPNVAEGQKICFAPEGTTLPDGLVLKRRKIRGVESAGMVLSERELGLSDKHEGILVLDPGAPVGAPAREVLPGGPAIEVDNKAITTRPDLWGHFGAARELAAVLGRDLAPLDLGPEVPGDAPQVSVAVECTDLCPRYLGWVIGGIEVGPSPAWLKQRLEDAGQRPINNVVDLTNYILLECGQPLHAFDRRQIAQGRIVVRRAAEGERVTTLDGVERELPEGACVIADPERAVAIAGVMGLENSEVAKDTTEIVLEVANFEMTSIRATAKALGLRTESAVRFEKGLDVEGVPAAARRFFTLLQRVCPSARPLGGAADVRTPPGPPRTIPMPEDFVSRRLGIDVPAARADEILGRLGFGVARKEGALRVTVPSWRRTEVSIPEDVVEEVGRIQGWDRIAPVPLHGRLEPVPLEPERAARDRARRALTYEAGLCEVFVYPFVTADECARAGLEPPSLQLANAEQPGLDLMAASLVPKVLAVVATNLKYRDDVALYAIAPVFEAGGEDGLPRQDERITLAIARRGKESPALEVKGVVETVLDAFRVAGARVDQKEGPAWLHSGRAAELRRGRDAFGWFGELAPRVARAFGIEAPCAVADLDMVALRGAAGRLGRMRPISRYPTVPYDVAVVVDRTTPAAEVEAALRKVDDRLVRDVRLFDVYEGKNLPEGKRSLAFALVFGALDRTLERKDVERLRAGVATSIEKRGWSLRG